MLRSHLIRSLALILFLSPALQADVIPSRIRTSQEKRDRATTCSRLVRLGVPTPDARLRVSRMTPPVAAHYAAEPRALHVAAGLEPEELLLGLGFFAGIFIVITAASQGQ